MKGEALEKLGEGFIADIQPGGQRRDRAGGFNPPVVQGPPRRPRNYRRVACLGGPPLFGP